MLGAVGLLGGIDGARDAAAGSGGGLRDVVSAVPDEKEQEQEELGLRFRG